MVSTLFLRFFLGGWEESIWEDRMCSGTYRDKMCRRGGGCIKKRGGVFESVKKM